MNILKVMFLFIGIRWSLVNFGKMHYKAEIPTLNLLLQAIGIVGFLTLQFNLL